MEKFFINYEGSKKKAFNIVMSNLKFKHNKSGFIKFPPSQPTPEKHEKKANFCLLNASFAAQKKIMILFRSRAFFSLCMQRS